MKAMGTLAVYLMAATVVSAGPASLNVVGDWQVRVETGGKVVTCDVEPAATVGVADERVVQLPVYNGKAAPYKRGYKLAKLRLKECTAPYALSGESLVVRSESGETVYVRGKDYEVELAWGCVGRLEGGAIKADTPVRVSYVYGVMRLDSVVLDPGKRIFLRKGVPHLANPEPPAMGEGEIRLANIWVRACRQRLEKTCIFPIGETSYPEPGKTVPSPAERLIPKTMAKLNGGKRVRILAWGDSVTDGTYLRDPKAERWQEQFVGRLRTRFPKAEIELMTEAWGGNNTGSYFNEPPGSLHNYKEKVLDRAPDLIVSEFLNDKNYTEKMVFERYGRIGDDFKRIGAEWIILTPHYVQPVLMGLTAETEVDEDPRPYVKALRRFAGEKQIALADASLRYGRLWRQGIPFSTLMMNGINHPNPAGMRLFADALMELFP